MLSINYKELIDDLEKHCVSTKETAKYGKSVEVVDLLSSTDDLLGFCKGNVIKYVARYGKKTDLGDLTDLYKAIHYIMIMIGEVKNADNS